MTHTPTDTPRDPVYLPPHTPVLVRHHETGNICVEPIGKLSYACGWKQNKALLVDTDVWDGSSWSTAFCIHRHRTRDGLLQWVHPAGVAMVSHIPAPPRVCSRLPSFPELASDICEGTPTVQMFRDPYEAQEEYTRILALGAPAHVSFHEGNIYVSQQPPSLPSSWSLPEPIPCPYEGYVYTLETEHGWFQAGAGTLCVPGIQALS